MKNLLLIAIAILAVGCGKKEVASEIVEPVTEVNPIGEKLEEVKEEVKNKEPVDGSNPKPEGVSVEELEPRERLIYRIGSDVPYTGKSFELYPNGKLAEVFTFKDGLPNGLMTKWYMNGQKQAELNFKDGMPDGLAVEWYETGEKMSEVTYKDGSPVDGSEKSFEKHELTEEEKVVEVNEEAKTEEPVVETKPDHDNNIDNLVKKITLIVDGNEISSSRNIEGFPEFDYFYITSSGAFSIDELRIGRTYDSVIKKTVSDDDENILFYDSFDYSVGEKLIEQEGWFSEGLPQSIARVSDIYNVTKGSLINDEINSAGNRVSAEASDVIAGIGIKFTETIAFKPDDDVFISFLMRPEGIIGEGIWGGYFVVGAMPSEGKGIVFGKPGNSSTYSIENQGGPLIEASGVESKLGKTSLVVIKIEDKELDKPKETVAVVKPKPEGVNQDELELRGFPPNSLYYLIASDTPYTGKVYSLHPNGKMKSQTNYKDGKEDGLFFSWHINGKKYREGNLKDGKKDGLVMTWHKNGQKSWEENYKDGKLDGLMAAWHKNGQKRYEEIYKNDRIVKGSAKYWNSKGEPVDTYIEAKYIPESDGVNTLELEERGEYSDHIKVSDDPSYTGESFELYPNGEFKTKANFKDGKLDGLQVAWHENGQKWSEINFKDGKENGLKTTWYVNGQKQSEINFKNGEPEGLGFAWHRNGQKAMEGMVENGKEVSQKFWNSKGESVNSFEETGLK